jgi:hypothetical protein
LSFAGLVQPVLDRHCVRCHRPGGADAAAARTDLTAGRAYDTLMSFGGNDLAKLAFERDRSVAGQGVAAGSKLWSLLAAGPGHHKVALDADSRERLATWMDTYAQRQGHYSDEQARALARLRAQLTGLLEPAGR